MIFSYQDIVLWDFSPSFGYEIQKARPAIVVSNNVINQKSPFCVVIPLTTNTKVQGPTRILISPNHQNNLDKNSIILCDQIRSLDIRRGIKILGKVDDESMKKIQEGIDIVLNRY